MTTNLFSTLNIPDELQIALSNLVLATPVSAYSGVWTPNVAHQAGGVPDVISSTERPFTVVDGIVTTLVDFNVVSIAGCASSSISITNFPLWDRSVSLNVFGNTQTLTTISILSMGWSGVGTLTAFFNMPILAAFGTAGIRAIAQYPASM